MWTFGNLWSMCSKYYRYAYGSVLTAVIIGVATLLLSLFFAVR